MSALISTARPYADQDDCRSTYLHFLIVGITASNLMLGISSVMHGHYSQRLRQLRKEKSLTLQQVADALGVTRAVYPSGRQVAANPI